MATTLIPTLTLLARADSIDDASDSLCITAIPDSRGHVPITACNSYYNYDPGLTPNIVFAVLFGLCTLAHLVQAIIHRKGFCWVIVMGTSWELFAFVTRALGSNNQQNSGLAISSAILVALAPLWVNAFAYMVVGRLIHAFHPEQKVWKVKGASIGKYFVWLDIVCFLVQLVGATMLNPENDANTLNLGKNLYMVGIGTQQGFIVLFTAIIVRFFVAMDRLEKGGVGPTSRRWRWLTWAIFFVLLMITIRIIFRLVEYTGGVDPNKNPIPFKEVYQLALDAMPMFFAILTLNVCHPGSVLRAEFNNFPTRKEKKAARKAAKEEKKRTKAAKNGGYASSDEGSERQMMAQDIEMIATEGSPKHGYARVAPDGAIV